MDKNNAVLITCQLGCRGKYNLCIPKIVELVESNKTVFMIYGKHVQDTLENINDFKFAIKYQGECPIGLYISKGDNYVDSRDSNKL